MTSKQPEVDEYIVSEMMMAYIDGLHGQSHQNYAVSQREEDAMRNVLALLVSKGYTRAESLKQNTGQPVSGDGVNGSPSNEDGSATRKDAGASPVNTQPHGQVVPSSGCVYCDLNVCDENRHIVSAAPSVVDVEALAVFIKRHIAGQTKGIANHDGSYDVYGEHTINCFSLAQAILEALRRQGLMVNTKEGEG